MLIKLGVYGKRKRPVFLYSSSPLNEIRLRFDGLHDRLQNRILKPPERLKAMGLAV